MKFAQWLVAILLLTASLGQLNRLFIGDNADLVLYVNDLLVGVLALWYVGHALIARGSWKIPSSMLWLFGWIAIGSLGLLLAGTTLGRNELLVSLSYLFRFTAYSVLFFFVAHDSVVYAMSGVQRRVRWWTWVVMAAMVLMAIGGFIQLYFLPDLSALAAYGWDPHLDRLVTAMLDPNYAGCFFAIGLAVSTSLFLHLDKQYGTRLILLTISVLLLVALLLTYSRSGYLMAAIVLGVIALVRSRALLLIGILLAILVILSVPRIQTRLLGALRVDASAQPRIISWQNSWHIAQDNLLIGVGFNTYRYAQDRYGIVSLDKSGNAGAGADSSWLFILATTGVTGLFFFVANYAALGWQGVRLALEQSDAWQRGLGLAFVAMLAGLAVASQFNNALFYTWIMEPFWLLAGLMCGLWSIKDADRAS
jgi:O-antigen ligase